jgi:predicted Zn-ribbon and HTH transcriptional regulator
VSIEVRTADPANELERLDRWSFWSAPDREGEAGRVVVGVTGAFAVLSDPKSTRRARDGVVLRTRRLEHVKKAARRIEEDLRRAGHDIEVRPVLCVDAGIEFAPRTVRGVVVVPPSRLAEEIASGPAVLQPSMARRASLALRKAAARITAVHVSPVPAAG